MSRVGQVLLLALLVLPCSADPRDVVVRAEDVPENPNAAFAIRVDVDRAERRYDIGDRLTLRIQTERDCYVTIFDVGTSGRVTVLLPNRYREDNLIKAGREVRFPTQGDGFEYEIAGPEGVERIVVVGTTSKLDLVAQDLAQYESSRSLFMTAAADKGRSLMSDARDVLVKAEQGEWASDQVTFQIGQTVVAPEDVPIAEPPPAEPVIEEPEATTLDEPEVTIPEQPDVEGIPLAPGDLQGVWAFVAGVSDYPGDDMDLRYAAKDAQVFAAVLNQALGVPADHILLRTDSEATAAGFQQGIDWLAQNAGANDTAYIFYSGHGGYMPDQNGDEEDGQDEYICVYGGYVLDDDYGQMVNRIKCRSIVEFTDTCFSGGTSREFKSVMRGSRDLGQHLTDGFGPKEWGPGSREVAPEGVCLFAASQPDQPSAESGSLEEGVFTYFLAKGLTGEADADGDNEITLQELFGYTRREVLRATRNQQEPYLLPQGGDAVLAGRAAHTREITPIAVE